MVQNAGGRSSDDELPTSPAIEVVPLRSDHREGRNLDPLPNWPRHMQLKPVEDHAIKVWFAGRYLTSMVYEAADGILQFPPLPYDEHVCVLHGRAILTTAHGRRHEFAAGDVFVVPSGWSGTWEFRDGYRELVTFEAASVDAAMRDWFPES